MAREMLCEHDISNPLPVELENKNSLSLISQNWGVHRAADAIGYAISMWWLLIPSKENNWVFVRWVGGKSGPMSAFCLKSQPYGTRRIISQPNPRDQKGEIHRVLRGLETWPLGSSLVEEAEFQVTLWEWEIDLNRVLLWNLQKRSKTKKTQGWQKRWEMIPLSYKTNTRL